MKILILGYKGMLGSDLFTRLCLDHEVSGKDVEDFDLADEASCRQVVNAANPEVVINAAAYTNVDGAETSRDLCFAVNAQGVKYLAEVCHERGAKIVHFSTDYVFNGEKGALYSEEDTTSPINIYGDSKLAGERFLQECAGNFLLVRTSWLYGKNGKNFVSTILAKAKSERKLSVVDDQEGSPTYTWDLAEAVKILIEREHSGIFHVTNRGICSWYEFTLKILQYAGLHDVVVTPCKSDALSRPARRPRFSGLSNKHFMEETGKTLRVWQLALQEYMNRMEQTFR